MKIAKDAVVGIEYTLTGEDGKVIDTNVGSDLLYYLHGHSNIVEGLENHLSGKTEGDAFDVIVPPELGYGKRSEELVLEVERSQLPDDFEPQKGRRLTMNGPQGPRSVTVTKVKLKTVVLDANHELADLALHFTGAIKKVRKATSEELDHGHVHAPGHHHH